MLDEINSKKLNRELQALGLDRKSAAVYMSLLHLGEVGSSKIINDTDLHGQYVYQSLEKLEKMGLAQHIIKRGRKKFTAKSPSVLVKLAEEQKIQAEKLAGELNKLMILPPEQTFEIYQGSESYISHEFDLINRAPENCELLIIGGSGDKFNDEMGERLKEYTGIQFKKNISMRYIGSEDQRAAMPQMHGPRRNFKIRYLPGLFTGQVNTNLWPDILGFNIYGEPVTRFTISSKIVAESYKQFFETLWGLAKE
ncbi:MAG: hypothetical protein KGJ89_01405 [Patescibacteria group bacterium]|nr:hypothetical protein [Patescibacteria group bacterium]MDE2015169.1 hypothetical protein [Patescibacteria group bacterium]MDE2226597.1 hypothetical protein [Patescibacteria group bacterium]